MLRTNLNDNFDENIEDFLIFNDIIVMTGDFKFIYIKYKNCVYFKKINYKITSLSSDGKNNILFVGFENGLFSAIKIFSSPEGIEVEELYNLNLEKNIKSITFSPQTEKSYILSDDDVYIYGKEIQMIENIKNFSKIYAFQNLLYLCDNEKILILDIYNLNIIKIINDNLLFRIKDFKLDSQNLYLCFDRIVKVYHLEDFSFNYIIYINENISCFDIYKVSIKSLTFIGTTDGKVKIFERNFKIEDKKVEVKEIKKILNLYVITKCRI